MNDTTGLQLCKGPLGWGRIGSRPWNLPHEWDMTQKESKQHTFHNGCGTQDWCKSKSCAHGAPQGVHGKPV